MHRRRFQIANILSAIIWAPVVLSPGWLVAKGAGSIPELDVTSRFGLAGIAVAALIVVAVIVFKFRGKRAARA